MKEETAAQIVQWLERGKGKKAPSRHRIASRVGRIPPWPFLNGLPTKRTRAKGTFEFAKHFHMWRLHINIGVCWYK